MLVASILGGIMNGIVGMATVALYPTLLYVGVPPIIANVTITVGLLFSDFSAVLSSRREFKRVVPETIKFSTLITAGAIVGAIVLLFSSSKSFKEITPVVILLSGILMMIPKKDNTHKSISKIVLIISAIATLLVGVYVGYFGAGAGILMTAVLSISNDYEYAENNAVRNVSALCAHIVTVVIFIFTMKIEWLIVPLIAIGLFIGRYLGPIIVRYVPSKVMRYVVSIFAIVVALILGYQAFF